MVYSPPTDATMFPELFVSSAAEIPGITKFIKIYRGHCKNRNININLHC